MVPAALHNADINKQSVGSLIFINFFLTFSLLSLCLIDRAKAQEAAPSGYILIGTIQSRDFIGAVISDSKGEQLLYRLGSKLPDGSQVVKVQSNSILLKGTDGNNYEMFIIQGMTTAAAGKTYLPADPFAGGKRRPAEERQRIGGKRVQRPTADDDN